MLKRLQPQLAAVPLEHGYPAEPFGPTNFYRFAPLLTSYAGKAWHKAQRLLIGQTPSAASRAARRGEGHVSTSSPCTCRIEPEGGRLDLGTGLCRW